MHNLPLPGTPQQIEFARLNLTYTVMSKRKLLQLVNEKHVTGWDDPRMPTISGLRRRGYTPEAIRRFADEIGVAKRENVVDVGLLEFFVREDLNKRAPRAMAVLRPLKIVLENYPGRPDRATWTSSTTRRIRRPARARCRSRACSTSSSDDFLEDPPKKFFRLAPGREVRLRNAYLITCQSSREGRRRRGRRAALHVRPGDARRRRAGRPQGQGDAALGVGARTRSTPRCGCTIGCSRSRIPAPATRIFSTQLNPAVARGRARREARAVARRGAAPARAIQFERLGYFCVDPDSTPGAPVFNRTVTLKDTWAKAQKDSA